MLRTNSNDLITMAVAGYVSAPMLARSPYQPDTEGVGRVLIGMSGIVYNARVGDPAFGWAGDHVEPSVSIAHPDFGIDHAMHYLSCVGNEAIVASGSALGAQGVVTGEHARLLVDFAPSILELLCIGDRILIKTRGRGMKLLDFPSVLVKKTSPELLNRWGIRVSKENKLEVPVVAMIPAHLMGSGAELTPEYVDQDLMTGDRDELVRHGIDKLRLGDLVAVMNTDHTYGRGYKQGGVTIGIIIHGDSVMTGHGPGCQDMLVSADSTIDPIITPNANIAGILGIC